MSSSLLAWTALFLAAADDGGGGGAPQSNMFSSMFLPMIIIIAAFYFLMIRPQKRRDAERREMLSRVKDKDRVITIGGLHGQVVQTDEDEITLRIDARKDVQVKISRSSISSIRGSDGGDPAPSQPPSTS